MIPRRIAPWRLARGRLFNPAALLMLALTVIAVAACGDDDEDVGDGGNGTPAATTPPADGDGGGDGIDYGSLSGEIAIDGSSTVYPISAAMAEAFDDVSDVRVNVAFSGTGGGFEKFCRGEIQVSDASRPIKDDEVQACADNGITDIVEFQVAVDALTVMVNPGNDFIDCLTVQQLHDLFKTDGYDNWSELDPSYPDETIDFYVPGTDSGTFDYFVEAIIEDVDENATHRGDPDRTTASEDDNILASGIENDSNAIGYFGFAYFQGAGSALKAVHIDGGGGCVTPTFEAALDGSYVPLSRPLFIYTTESLLAESDQTVLGFIDFYLNNVDIIVPEVGYVTMPDDLLAQQVAKIEAFLP